MGLADISTLRLFRGIHDVAVMEVISHEAIFAHYISRINSVQFFL